MRTAYDLSPLCRSMIGVDRMADFAETAMKRDADRNYPPYDIEKTGEDAYRITIATAGYSARELEIVAQPNLLVITGRSANDDRDRHYLHRGIAGRGFERRFELAEFVVVKSADYADGLLTIDLAREAPEALKPRRIELEAKGARRIDQPRAKRQAA